MSLKVFALLFAVLLAANALTMNTQHNKKDDQNGGSKGNGKGRGPPPSLEQEFFEGLEGEKEGEFKPSL